MQSRLDEVDVTQAWHKAFGPYVERQTRSIRLQEGGKLWVKLDSGALKEELAMSKGQIVTRLNEELGRKVVHELIIQ